MNGKQRWKELLMVEGAGNDGRSAEVSEGGNSGSAADMLTFLGARLQGKRLLAAKAVGVL